MMSRPFFACLFIAMLAGCSPQGEAEVSPLEALARCAEQFTGEGSGEASLTTESHSRSLVDQVLAEQTPAGISSRRNHRDLRERADRGEISAQFEACASVSGEQVGLSLLAALVETGNPDAQFLRASLFDNGRFGLQESSAEASRLYRLSAEQGHVEAQYKLGHMTLIGRGIPKDELEGIFWIRRAADNGYAPAMYTIALDYALKSESEAVYWFERASKLGDGFAQAHFIAIYEHGLLGVQRDLMRAHMWANIVYAGNRGLMREHFERLELEMTPEQISEAQAMATRCFNSGYQDCGW